MPGPGGIFPPRLPIGAFDRTSILFEGIKTMSDLYYSLLERHQKLDAHLRAALRRPFVDPFEIARIKKLKLAIKDRLARRRRVIATA
jgi:hypothetical protein